MSEELQPIRCPAPLQQSLPEPWDEARPMASREDLSAARACALAQAPSPPPRRQPRPPAELSAHSELSPHINSWTSCLF